MINHPELNRYHGLPIGWAEISVAFHDVDAMKVVWHGNYIKYFEIARCEALKLIDYDIPRMQESGYAWPVVDIRSRFIQPVTYGDRLWVAAIIAEWELRLLIKYLVFNQDTDKVVTRGCTVQVPLHLKTMSMPFGCPDLLQQRVEAWQDCSDRS